MTTGLGQAALLRTISLMEQLQLESFNEVRKLSVHTSLLVLWNSDHPQACLLGSEARPNSNHCLNSF